MWDINWYELIAIILMNEGAVIQHGTMTELLEAPNDQFVEDFINAQRNSLNFMRGKSPRKIG